MLSQKKNSNIRLYSLILLLGIIWPGGIVQGQYIRDYKPVQRHQPQKDVARKPPIGEIILSEDFDESLFPPKSWSRQTLNAEASWQRLQLPESPFALIQEDSKASAICRWSLQEQDEWLISPLIDVGDYQSLYVTFYGGFSKDYLDFANLRLMVKHPDSASWKPLWNAKQDTITSKEWMWRYQEIPAFSWTGGHIRLAWQYTGIKGDLVGLDAVAVYAGGPAKGTAITAFRFPGETSESSINPDNHTVQVTVAQGATLKGIVPEISISPGASLQPPPEEPQDFTLNTPFVYTVYAADTTVQPQEWKIFISMENVSAAANIQDFALPQQTSPASIDTTNHTVSIEVAYGTQLDSLMPEVTLSAGARIEPPLDGPQAFEDGVPRSFTVYPQDPDAEPVEWKITVNVQDYLNNILSFSLEEQINPAEIDSAGHQVFIEIASDADLSSLTPSLTVSPGASVSPDSGQMIAVTPDEPVIYTVTAANGDRQEWQVYIYKQITTLLLEQFDANQAMPQGWQIDSTNIPYTWQIGKMPTFPFDSINPYSNYSALCPWSVYTSDEKLISPAIELPANKQVSTVFYAGFSRHWQDSAAISLHVRQAGSASAENVWNAANDTSAGKDWRWRLVWVDLHDYAGQEIELVWKYQGGFGDLAALDDIYVAESAALYSEFFNPSLNVFKQKTPDVRLYPNPAPDRVYFSKPVGDVRLYNIHGRLIRQSGKNSVQMLKLTDLANGVYILKFRINGQHLTRKLIKTDRTR